MVNKYSINSQDVLIRRPPKSASSTSLCKQPQLSVALVSHLLVRVLVETINALDLGRFHQEDLNNLVKTFERSVECPHRPMTLSRTGDEGMLAKQIKRMENDALKNTDEVIFNLFVVS